MFFQMFGEFYPDHWRKYCLCRNGASRNIRSLRYLCQKKKKGNFSFLQGSALIFNLSTKKWSPRLKKEVLGTITSTLLKNHLKERNQQVPVSSKKCLNLSALTKNWRQVLEKHSSWKTENADITHIYDFEKKKLPFALWRETETPPLFQ